MATMVNFVQASLPANGVFCDHSNISNVASQMRFGVPAEISLDLHIICIAVCLISHTKTNYEIIVNN